MLLSLFKFTVVNISMWSKYVVVDTTVDNRSKEAEADKPDSKDLGN